MIEHRFSNVSRDPQTGFSSKSPMLLGIVLVTTFAFVAGAQSSKHTVSVEFSYDFTLIPACSSTVAKKCIAQFNVYDISAAKAHEAVLDSCASRRQGTRQEHYRREPTAPFRVEKTLACSDGTDGDW